MALVACSLETTAQLRVYRPPEPANHARLSPRGLTQLLRNVLMRSQTNQPIKLSQFGPPVGDGKSRLLCLLRALTASVEAPAAT